MSNKFILFKIGKNYFGLRLILVREVLLCRKIDELPKASANIKGIFNLRGQVIPVVNFSRILGMDAPEADKPKIIVLEGGEDRKDFGFEIDEAVEVVRIDNSLMDVQIDTDVTVGNFVHSVVSELPGHKDKIIYILNEKFTLDKKKALKEVS
jgi:chemotaxis signal transduction protein